MSGNHDLTRRSVLGATGLAVAGGFSAPAAADHDTSTGNAYPSDCEGPGFNDTPQLPDSPWQVHDACRPHPPAVDPGTPSYPDPPEDATVLMGDGENGAISLDDWNNASSWTVEDGYVVVGDEPLVSKQGFGDGHYHIEWQTPTSVTGSGQDPGNSGFFLANRYEIQILNNYENPTFPDGYAGSVFGQHPPLVNPSLPKGTWNTYDIIWKAPRFADDGSLESPGVVTIFWNDVLVQTQTVLNGPTAYRAAPGYSQHPVEAPIQIQNHGQPVRFRNVWYEPTPTPSSVTAFEGDSLTALEASSTVEASITNTYDSELTSGSVTINAPDGTEVTVTPKQGTSFDSLAPGASQSMSWEVTRPGEDSGPYLLPASTSYSVNGEQRSVDYQVPIYPEPIPEAPEEGAHYTKTVLSDRMNNLIDLAVANDGRVFYVTRGDFFAGEVGGRMEVGVYDPETDEDTVVFEKDVFTGINMEDGGQGISLDPNFEENGYVYIYYSPSNEEIADTQEELDYLNNAGDTGDEEARPPSESIGDPYNLLSRFTMQDGSISANSETEILRVPVQRDMCCHEGGDIQWGPDGEHLYLTTGDNTYSKTETDAPGYAPLDERDGRDYYDAQRTSADTSDLRGKILRIIPNEDGSYDIPDGNLFTGEEYAEERENGTVLPEIYIMGARNPFQAGVDLETGTLFWGDYSADSRVWSDVRGPPGYNEFNRATDAGFYGWPYFTGPYAFYDYDYATQTSGDLFDASGPINDSPHSGGIEQLPPAEDPLIWYPGNWSRALENVPSDYDVPDEAPFPNFEGGAPIGGPVFRYQEDYTKRGLPPWLDGHYIISEFGGGWLRTVSFENGDVAQGAIKEISPLASNVQLTSPIDIEVGPEGMLYVAEYGSFSGEGSKLSRIERTESAPAQPVSTPFGFDAGGSFIDGTVTINGVEYVESSPAVTMSGNADASGTGTAAQTNMYPDPPNPIAGTENDALYQTEAYGGDLTFEVMVDDGTYDVTLYFAETNTGLSEGDRVFNVSLEGNQVLSEFDIAAEAGTNQAIKRTFKGIQVSDGKLTISTETLSDNSKISGFAITESQPEPTEEVSVPFGFNSGGGNASVTIDGLEFTSETGSAVRVFGDASASGTGTAVGTFSTDESIAGTEHDALYQSEHHGGDLSYNVGIANGTYEVTLYFAETNGTLPEGQRVFNVSVEGQTVYSPLDILAETDRYTALTKTVTVQVEDGVLDIDTETQSDNSKFSGFAIRPAEGGGNAIDPGTTIELGAEMTGWQGRAPSSIEGTTNPTLPLQAGETYTIEWTNIDGYPHDFDVLNAQGDTIVDNGLLSTQGETQTVELTVTEEMAEYYCSVHPSRMRGAIDVVGGGGGGGGMDPVVGDSPPTDPNGDGLYEDVNGDGEVNYADVVDLFENFDSAAVQNNPEAFDFNGNGRLDFDDIITLFSSL